MVLSCLSEMQSGRDVIGGLIDKRDIWAPGGLAGNLGSFLGYV